MQATDQSTSTSRALVLADKILPAIMDPAQFPQIAGGKSQTDKINLARDVADIVVRRNADESQDEGFALTLVTTMDEFPKKASKAAVSRLLDTGMSSMEVHGAMKFATELDVSLDFAITWMKYWDVTLSDEDEVSACADSTIELLNAQPRGVGINAQGKLQGGTRPRNPHSVPDPGQSQDREQILLTARQLGEDLNKRTLDELVAHYGGS